MEKPTKRYGVFLHTVLTQCSRQWNKCKHCATTCVHHWVKAVPSVKSPHCGPSLGSNRSVLTFCNTWGVLQTHHNFDRQVAAQRINVVVLVTLNFFNVTYNSTALVQLTRAVSKLWCWYAVWKWIATCALHFRGFVLMNEIWVILVIWNIVFVCTFSVDGIVGCTSLLTCRIVVVAYKCGHEDRPRDCVTCLSMLSKPDTV